MSRQRLLHNRRSRRFWILTSGMTVLALAAGVWLILDGFVVQDGGDVEPVAIVEDYSGIDQIQTAPELDNGQDDLGSSGDDSDAGSDLAVSPGLDNGQDDSESSGQNADAEPDLIATRTPRQTDLGLEEIVREFILGLYGGETPDAESDYVPSTDAKLESADPETRRRGEFEVAVRLQLWSRQADDPYYRLLNESVFDVWWTCFMEYGVPSLEEFGPLTQQQQDALLEELGLVGERMEQLQTECWSRARVYAGKDEETDRLLQLQHEYYLEVAQDWVRENPDSVVPLAQSVVPMPQ